MLSSRVRTRENGTFILGPLLERQRFFVIAYHKEKGIAHQMNQAPGAWLDLVLVPGAQITGTVTAASTGKPVPKARILIKGLYGQEATSDDKGQYTLPMVPTSSGWWGTALVAVADDFQRQERTNLVLKSGAAQTVNFLLEDGRTLKGKVINAKTLQPMASATVAEGWEPYHKATLTDKSGAFVLRHVDTEPNRVFVAKAEGHISSRLQSDGTGSLEFRLETSLSFSGRVLDPQGQPLEGARIRYVQTKTAEGYTKPGSNARGRKEHTGSDGHFKFDGVLPGQVVALAFHDDYAHAETEPVDIPVGGPSPDDIVINVKAGATIEGVVRDTDGQPVLDLPVTAWTNWNRSTNTGSRHARRFQWQERANVFTDEQGRFVLKGIAGGKVTITAGTWGKGRVTKQVDVAAGERQTGIDLIFGGVTISGVLLASDGQPVSSGYVWAQRVVQPTSGRRRWQAGWSANAQTDSLGRFSLMGLKDGTYNITGRDASGSSTKPMKNISTGTQALELRLPGSQILRIKVESVVTGRALRKFNLSINPKRKGTAGLQARLAEAARPTNWGGNVEAPDGRFERAVTPGVYTVFVKSEGHAPKSLDEVVVEEGIDPEPITITLEGGASIQGVIRDAAGEPLPNARVNLQVQQTPGATRDPNRWRRRAADQSDQNGRYFIQGVAQGRYVLTVNMGQKGQGTTQISVSGQDTVMQDLQVLPTGKVAFNVVDADGNPIEKVYFSFHDPERQSRWLGWAMWTNVQGFSTSGPVRQGATKCRYLRLESGPSLPTMGAGA
ncbi:MAG: carboxypeptidase regulatory-like domain-containing protein, partial [Longimicrobiales bacterium]